MGGPRGSWVRVFAPATVANVSCGFDIFGFALERPGDTVAARLRDEPGVVLSEVRGDGGVLPRDAGRNTSAVAVAELLSGVDGGDEVGIELRLEKGMPLSSGLGSSAASAVAAVVAASELLGGRLPRRDLLRGAVAGEEAACGFPHADNAAPSLLGGFLLVRGAGSRVAYQSLPVPEGLSCALLHPHLKIGTRGARAALPESVPLERLVEQTGNAAAFVAGLFRGDWDLLASALIDVVAEPVRAGRVPGFEEVREASLAAGALGCGLSGSGPTLFALCRGRARAEGVARAMREAFVEGGFGRADAWTSPVGAPGARVLPEPD